MRRLCERPGCGAPAEASYGIDQVKLVVWIDVLEVAERESAGRLCRRHADALEGPRGWTTDDRRQPVPTLFRATNAGETPAAPAKPKKERKSRVSSVDTPSLFESIRRDIEGAAGAEPAGEPTVPDAGTTEPTEPDTTEVVEVTEATDAPDPDETKAMPWTPKLGRGANSDDSTRPVGRLLGRAFGEQSEDR